MNGCIKYNYQCDLCKKATSTTIEVRAILGLCPECDQGWLNNGHEVKP